MDSYCVRYLLLPMEKVALYFTVITIDADYEGANRKHHYSCPRPLAINLKECQAQYDLASAETVPSTLAMSFFISEMALVAVLVGKHL